MLSYLHEFHAGNHADILKHVTLLYVLEYLNKKNKPYSFLDSHSGAGLYNLNDEKALKTGEASRGIQRLISECRNKTVPESLNSYLQLVEKCLKKGFYPGSPAIEVLTACEGSQIFLTELHKTEFQTLENNLSRLSEWDNCCGYSVYNSSGWDLLKSKVPPVLKRGAVLCDPSYEELSDYHNAADILSSVHKKWSGATVMLWYPLLANKADEIDSMKQQILSTVKNRDSHTEVLDVQLCIDTEDSHMETTLENSIGSAKPRLYGSGMFVINPSWDLDQHLNNCLPYLASLLGNENKGSFSLKML